MAADQPLECGDARFILLDEVGGTSVFIQTASLVLFDPDADQVARNVVALRQTVQRLAADNDRGCGALTIEDAVREARYSLDPPSPDPLHPGYKILAVQRDAL